MQNIYIRNRLLIITFRLPKHRCTEPFTGENIDIQNPLFISFRSHLYLRFAVIRMGFCPFIELWTVHFELLSGTCSRNSFSFEVVPPFVETAAESVCRAIG